MDDSPGETLDKCARMMRLDLHPEVKDLPGGAAIECVAEKGDSSKIELLKDSIMVQRLVEDYFFHRKSAT